MARGADLFVVCKNCGSEVSPYVTECPYCGQRVRKRSPKIERDTPTPEPRAERERRQREAAALGEAEPRARRPRGRRMGAGPRRVAAPRVRADGRPVVTYALVAASFAIYLLTVSTLVDPTDLVLLGHLDGDWWRVLSAPFVHLGFGGSSVFAGGAYQFATMIGVGVFGWLLERRHGHFTVAGIALVAGAGGMAVASVLEAPLVAGGANGIALGLLCAWAVPDLLDWRRGEDYEGDLLGTATIAVVLLLMPLAVPFASAVAGITGAVAGLLIGLVLSRRR